MAKNSPQDLENREYFSTNLNRIMAEKGVRQIDLHDNTDIPKSTITGYVKGRSLPTLGNLQKIADFLKVKKSDLDLRFSSEGEKPKLETADIWVNTMIEIIDSEALCKIEGAEDKDVMQNMTDYFQKIAHIGFEFIGAFEEGKSKKEAEIMLLEKYSVTDLNLALLLLKNLTAKLNSKD